MVVHAFPAAKLGALFLKQISKPIANVVKQQAKSSPVFRKYVCLPPARFYNWCEVKTKMWLLNLGQPVNITVLNEAASIELGANLLGEGVIFLIAAGILIAEYTRSSKKEAAKEEAKRKEMEDLKASLRDLFIQTEEQAAHIRELSRKLGDLDSRRGEGRSREIVESPKSEPPPGDSWGPLPKGDVSTDVAEDDTDFDRMEKMQTSPLRGVIFKAIRSVEKEFFYEDNHREREPGVLSIALKHLHENVYRIPMKI